MRYRKTARAVLILAAFILFVNVPSYAANTETVEDGYTVDGQSFDLIKGVFKFPSIVSIKVNSDDVMIDIPARFFYSDGFFAEDPYKYNPHLATASLCMAMSGFYSNEGDTGKNADYSNKWKNIRQYMEDIGVSAEDIHRNDYNKMRPSTDSIGVTIGRKTQSQNDNRTLIIISIRGSNYEQEWASNVTLGTAREAQGFSRAATLVFSEVEEYIRDKNLETEISEGNVDFWIAGYSRAGATTNLTAKRLIDKYVSGEDGNHVFAYCIEAPQGGIASREQSDSDYTCIHSVINKNDLVPYVAPKDMSFKRYGVDHYIPGTEADYAGGDSDNTFYDISSAEYSHLKSRMLEHLKAVNSHINFSDSFSSYGLDTGLFSYFNEKSFIQTGDFLLMNNYLDTFLSRVVDWTGTNREGYVKNLQSALRDLMSIIYDVHPARLELFRERLRRLWEKDVGKSDILGVVWYALGEWDKPNFKYKTYYTNKLINLLEKNKCVEALKLPYAVRQKLMRLDIPLLLNFIMTFASVDYRNNLYNTRGLTQVLTFALNSKNIMVNHDPEVTLAWLRAQDSLYDNEKESVTASSVTASLTPEVHATDSDVVTDIYEPSEIFIERGTSPKSSLPATVTAGYSSGNISELPVTWSDNNVIWYSPTYSLSGDLWEEIDDFEAALAEPDPLMGIFTGKVSVPDGTTVSADVSTDVTASVYLAGVPRLDPPETSLPDGEYNGPQTVFLSLPNGVTRDIVYSVSYIVENEDGSQEGDGDVQAPYTGLVKVGEEDLTEGREYLLSAYSESSNKAVSADSEMLVWYYKINPLNSEDMSSEYVSNTTSKTFALSKDKEVCWRVNSRDISFTASDGTASENPGDSIFADILLPSDADEVPAKNAYLTVIAVAGATRRGSYRIPVQSSTDGGVTWNDEETFTLETAGKKIETGTSSSGGGCNSGLALFGLGFSLAALMLKQRVY